jgi:hypothetical protein
MLARIANLISASWFLLMIIGRDWRWAGSPPTPPHEPMTLHGILLISLVCIWFVAAIILFFRSRLAWFGSLAGVSWSVVFYAWVLLSLAREYLFPNAQMLHDRELVNTAASVLAFLTELGFFGVCLALSVGLIIGLLKMRRELRWI